MNEKLVTIGSGCGIAAVVLAAVMGISMATCCKNTKVAVLDVEKVRAEAVAYKNVAAEADKYISALKARANEEDKVLQEEALALKKKIEASANGVKTHQKELQALGQKVALLRQKVQLQSQLIARATQTALAQITPVTQSALEEYTKKHNIAVIMPKSVLTYYNPDVEITEDFVKTLDAKEITVAYPDPAQLIQQEAPKEASKEASKDAPAETPAEEKAQPQKDGK